MRYTKLICLPLRMGRRLFYFLALRANDTKGVRS